MSFVKLDCGLLDSTLWIDRVAREIFITSLLMASPREFKDPVKQLHVQKIEETGFEVPEGWYGFIEAAGTGIIHRAGIPIPEGMMALERLSHEDPESRSPEFGGRRLARVDGGYIVLNFIKYREKDSTTAERSRRWRERKKQKELTTRVTDTPTRVIRHQAEAEAEVKKEKKALKAPIFLTTKQKAAEEILDHLNLKAGMQIPSERSTLEAIVKRLNENYKASDLKLVVDAKCHQWLKSPEMRIHLIPSTLFGAKFPQWLAVAKSIDAPKSSLSDAECAAQNKAILDARRLATEAAK